MADPFDPDIKSTLDVLRAAILDVSEDAILLLDSQQSILSFNAGAEAMFGYRPDEVVGKSVECLIPASVRTAHERHVESFRQAPDRSRRMGSRQGVTGLRRNGTEFPAGATITKLTIDGQTYFAAILRDITAQTAASNALAMKTRQLEVLSSTMSAYLAHGDIGAACGAIVAEAMQETQSEWGLFGMVLRPGTIRVLAHQGTTLPRSFHSPGDYELDIADDILGRVLATQQLVVSNDPVANFEVNFLLAGRPLLTSFLGMPVAAKNEPAGLLAVANRRGGYNQSDQDAITALARPAGVLFDNYVRRERELQLEAQLRQSQRREAIGQLAGGIAHDFNNILTVIVGCCEEVMGRMGADDPNQEPCLEIREAAKRAGDLVRQLLAFAGRQVLRPRRLDLNEAVNGSVSMLRRIIGEHIELVVVLDEECGTILADPGQLDQIIVNLTVNARDAMPEGGRLTVSTCNAVDDGSAGGTLGELQPGGQWALLSVTDTGHGMDDWTRSHVFEPFFTTKIAGDGTGLGLATVEGIVKQSGGTVYCDSSPGRGTTFRIYFPRVEGDAQGDNSAVVQDVARLVDVPQTRSEVVLLVEDDDSVRRLAGRTLRQAGYHVLEADTPEHAVNICHSYHGPLDLILTDVVLPQMSGPELVARLQQLRPDTPALFMSGYSRVQHSSSSQVSTSALLLKPFSPAMLTGKVREVLDGRSGTNRPTGIEPPLS